MKELEGLRRNWRGWDEELRDRDRTTAWNVKETTKIGEHQTNWNGMG